MPFTLLTKFRPENNYKMPQKETEDAEVQTITSLRQVFRSEFCQIASKCRIPEPSGYPCFLTIFKWTAFVIRIQLSIIILSLSEMWVIISLKTVTRLKNTDVFSNYAVVSCYRAKPCFHSQYFTILQKLKV